MVVLELRELPLAPVVFRIELELAAVAHQMIGARNGAGDAAADQLAVELVVRYVSVTGFRPS